MRVWEYAVQTPKLQNSQNQSKQQKESRLSRNQYELRVSGLDLAESCPRLWRDADYRVEGWKETEFLVFSSFFGFFDFARDEKERREKKCQREGKPHKQQPSMSSKSFGQLAKLRLVELKDGLSAGFLVFSVFFCFFCFMKIRSGLLSPCTEAATVPGCNYDTRTKSVCPGSFDGSNSCP